MTLIFRTIQTIARHVLRPKLEALTEPLIETYRVLPIDIDVFRHMNNAKYLNYLEAARWGMIVRGGFLKLAINYGWVFPLRSIHIEYYRQLTMFQKFEVRSQFIYFEEKWYHVLQRFYADGKEVARAHVVGTVRKGRENIPPEHYLKKMGLKSTEVVVPADVQKWFERVSGRYHS